jgi:hypothetical protein
MKLVYDEIQGWLENADNLIVPVQVVPFSLELLFYCCTLFCLLLQIENVFHNHSHNLNCFSQAEIITKKNIASCRVDFWNATKQSAKSACENDDHETAMESFCVAAAWY